MKHRVSMFAVFMLAFMTAATFALPDRSFAAGSQSSPTADKVQYYTTKYDKQWMSIIFDGSDSLDQNGCRALQPRGDQFQRPGIRRSARQVQDVVRQGRVDGIQ